MELRHARTSIYNHVSGIGGGMFMNLIPTFELGLGNSWLLCLPLFAQMLYVVTIEKDVARRMSDMTGYTAKEKFFTVTASVASYPFMLATAWTPFSSITPLLCIGLSIYVLGTVLFFMTLKVIVGAPPDKLFLNGPYRISRNPLYVAATAMFIGICVATANIVLFVYLAFSVLLQHHMILAEERICRQRYHSSYESYMGQVPRYLPWLA